ncbi:MAG: tetratricopeptide repeat protein [FCB group bacterium]|nr:tetratricopeptide repeat protein [FCB group bacterium]
MKKRFLLVVFLFLMIEIVGCSKSPEQKINDLYKRGLSYIQSYNYDAADTAFNKIENIDPQSPWGLYGAGLVFENKLQYYDALAIYLTLNKAQPSFAPAFAGAYRIYTHLGYHQYARHAAGTYHKLAKDSLRAQILLAKALFNSGEYIASRKELTKINAPSSADKKIINMISAQTYLMEGKIDSAQNMVNNIMTAPAQTSEFYLEAANYFEKAGFIDSAMVLSKISTTIKNTHFNPVIQHFYRALRNKYFYEARVIIKNLKKQKANQTLLAGMDIEYNLALNNRRKLNDLGSLYEAKYSQTLSAIIYQIKCSGAVDDLLTIGQDINTLEAILKRSNYEPEFVDFFNLEAALLFDHYEQSTRSLDKLQSIAGILSNNKNLKLHIALTSYIVGNFKEALDMLKLYTKYHRYQPDWLTGIGDVYSHQGLKKYDLAEASYQNALKVNKWYRPAFEHYVKMFEKQKKFKKALAVFDSYPHFEKNNPVIKLLKSKILIENNNLTEGFDLFKNNIKKVKENISLYTDLISLLNKKNQPDKKEQVAEMLTNNCPQNVDALIYLAEYKGDNNGYRASLAFAQQAEKIEPDNPDALALKARALYYLGEKPKAFKLFETINKTYPNNAKNLYYYSRLLAKDKTEFNKASNLARGAVFNSYGDPDCVLNLSYVYYQMGRYKLSRGEATKARNVQRNNPLPYFRIGLASYKLGDKKDAQKNLNKAIRLGLRGKDLKTAREILKQL